MDVQQLCTVLQACLSPNTEEIKAAESILSNVSALLQGGKVVYCCFLGEGWSFRKKFSRLGMFKGMLGLFRGLLISCRYFTLQHETRPGHVRNLLRVAVESSLDAGLTQAAAIAFKRVVERRWEPRDDGEGGPYCA